MPRGGSSRSPSRPSSSPSRSATTAPQPTHHAPPQQQHHHQAPPMMQQAPPSTGGGMMSGIGSTIVTGMALGAGSEVGHQVVKSFMGGSSGNKEESKEAAPQQQYQQSPPANYQQQQQAAAPQQNPCYSFNQHLINCLKTSQNDVSLCQTNMDMLMQCEKDFAPKTNFYGA